jgi:hypothetical protein
MSTVKPGVVGYLKTDDFTPTGSPYNVNQQPAANSVVSDLSTFFSSTPATDDAPGGVGAFMFLQVDTTATTVSKVVPRQFIITNIRALKTGADGGLGDVATLSKVSADGLTTTTLGVLNLNSKKNQFVCGPLADVAAPAAAAFLPNLAFTPNLAAGETLKVTSTKVTNCAATIYVDVIGA